MGLPFFSINYVRDIIMMVIRGTVATAITTEGLNLVVNTEYNFPADRVIWSDSAATGGGYQVDNAFFANGAAVGGNDYIAITNPRLGYIGKSGRFVELAA